jgi:phosphomevalonate kinase
VTEGFIDPRGLPPAIITLDTGEFFLPADGGRAKLGLGSSAALTVALVEAVRRWSPDDRRRQPLDLAELLAFHRSFQGGRGSGIDLAASTSGGVVEYRLIGEASNPDARPIDLPSTLEIVPVFTGRSASTSVFLARLYEGLQSDGGAIEVALERLGRDSAAGIVHLKSGNTAAFLEGIDAFAASMRNLGRVTGIPVVSDEHIRLGEIAAEIGVRYKPSGAGGGDVGLGFTNDPDAAAAFAGQATAAGFVPLDLLIDPDGVRVENEHVG